jgi:hypothetical protein
MVSSFKNYMKIFHGLPDHWGSPGRGPGGPPVGWPETNKIYLKAGTVYLLYKIHFHHTLMLSTSCVEMYNVQSY